MRSGYIVPSARPVAGPLHSSLGADDLGYQWPVVTRESVDSSFRIHTDYTRKADEELIEPNAEELEWLKVHYSIRNPLRYPTRQTTTPTTEEHWRALINGINWEASPGLGAFQTYGTNKQALGWDGFRCTEEANYERLKYLVSLRLQALEEGGRGECVCSGSCGACPTDIKIFVKMEPHKDQKIKEGRQRLISSLSLVDQVVDRCLFQTWQKTEIANCMQLAGKSGWSPMPEGFSQLMALGDKVLATDCSAFDWTYPAWLVDLTLTLRLAQTRGVSPQYERAVRARWKEVLGTDCMLRLPSGRVYRQVRPGIMKSGWLLTISGNSMAQELITLLGMRRARPSQPLGKLWSMGDDVLMQWDGSDSRDLETAIRTCGILQKFSVPRAEFSGFEFKGDLARPIVNPLYVDKHRYLLAYQPEEMLEEVVSAYGFLYALADDEHRRWLEPYLARYARWPTHVYRAWALGLSMNNSPALRQEVGKQVFPW
ncbi:hypothetical protein 2 [Amygdalus persica sobemo-like virus]|nr:hypothetical protein 2 [Amygdalus persica sobemo-like virus]